MDSIKLILTDPVAPPMNLGRLENIKDASEDKKKQIAKDFESIFVNKLLDTMRKTIGDWGMEKDAESKQVDGIFWLYLGRKLGEEGGLGMWKDIYKYLNDSDHKNIPDQSLDKNV